MNRVEAGAVRDLVAYLSLSAEGDRAAAGRALSQLSIAATALDAGGPALSADRATELLSVSGPSDMRLVEPLPVSHVEEVGLRARSAFEGAKPAVDEYDAIRGSDSSDRLLDVAVWWEEAEALLNRSSAAELRAGWLTAAQEYAAAAQLCGQFGREALEAHAAAHQKTAVAQSEYVAPAPSPSPASGAAL